jgi:hypothetical protein
MINLYWRASRFAPFGRSRRAIRGSLRSYLRRPSVGLVRLPRCGCAPLLSLSQKKRNKYKFDVFFFDSRDMAYYVSTSGATKSKKNVST